ncbi:matrixin family metalloprotease [Oceanirhabdus sp. W0125-5]|uniref:matrixin family metalloprotease n=1 Tax=Oceanirhabdus sp. W0125-5 TaxID=2999116 RepID=UPI0022F32EAA|nr:M57 family metalloprotease [Oceanirhabdus sp. W0125-5]WBW97035.1 M57 family metalloprotease [Oceanirhabdus sp. W0125-5]
MNKKIKSLLTCCLFSGLLFSSVSVYAYNTYGYQKVTGISNEFYYVDSGVSTTYETAIDDAVDDWESQVSSLSLRQTTNQSASNMDFYTYSKSDNVLGYTQFYTNATLDPGAPDKNWYWNKIYLNTATLGSKDGPKKQGVTAHEVGHALGLAHDNSNPNVLMCQTSSGRKVETVQSDDKNGVNSIY